MKILKFKTKKGEFALVDIVPAKTGGIKIENTFYSKLICQLNKVNEQQAREVIDSYEDRSVKSSVVTLHNTLLRNGIFLFKNPHGNISTCSEPGDCNDWFKAEEKTFYNPYIYKL